MAKGAIMTVSDKAFVTKLDRDHKREVDQRHKWQYGQTTTRGAGDKIKPVRQRNVAPVYDFRPRNFVRPSPDPSLGDYVRRAKGYRDGYAPNQLTGDFPDWEAESDALERSTSGYFYSFDRPTGPTRGEHVLGAAIDQAVARFENKATETLVKNEYDVVDEAASDAGDEHEQDEDFELV